MKQNQTRILDQCNLVGHQFDLKAVAEAYESKPNISIRYIKKTGPVYIIFSSHAIYFPNNEETARRVLIEQDRFEWFRNHPADAARIIFVRDVWKQWYAAGISTETPTPTALSKELKKLCADADEIYCLGVSAGGYAAIRYGIELNAKAVYAFAAQIDLSIELENTNNHEKNIILKKALELGADVANLERKLDSATGNIFYFYGSQSDQDLRHAKLLTGKKQVTLLPFRSSRHGTPFTGRALIYLVSQTAGSRLSIILWSRLPPLPPRLIQAGLLMVERISRIFKRTAWLQARN